MCTVPGVTLKINFSAGVSGNWRKLRNSVRPWLFHKKIFSKLVLHIKSNALNLKILNSYGTLVCRIDVHARLLTLRKNSPLHGPILICTFIDFEKIFTPAHLFFPAQQSYFGLHVYQFWEKISPCTVLFWSARLLILRQFSHLHVYFVLHVY